MVKVVFGRRRETDEGWSSGTGRCLCEGKVVMLELGVGSMWLDEAVDADGCGRIGVRSSVNWSLRVGDVSMPRTQYIIRIYIYMTTMYKIG